MSDLTGLIAALEGIKYATSLESAHRIADAALFLIGDEPVGEPDMDQVAS